MIGVLQLDGLGAEPVQRLLAAGRMPNLAAVLESRTRLDLKTPADRFPASVYPTLYSGLEPEQHGLFYPFQWDPERGRVVTSDHLPHPAMLWQRLGAAGVDSLVIDPYECLPAPAPGCRVISGWQLSERVVLRRWSEPRSMWPRAAVRDGLPPGATEVFGPRREDELQALAEALAEAPGRVADLLASELGNHPIEFAWASLISPHLAGHRLWADPRLDDVYAATDAALGRILSTLDSHGAESLIVCPIGMGIDRARADLLPEMLARVLGQAGSSAAPAAPESDSGSMWRLRAAAPARLRAAVAAAIPAPVARELTARLELRGVDWETTRAFAHPSDNQGYIRLNLAGRERDGSVDPATADSLCEWIESGLAGFRDSEGNQVVESVERVGGVDEVGLLPDLVVHWAAGSAGADPDTVHSDRFGIVRRHGAGSGRTGNHPADGAWIAGEGLVEPEGGARLSDVAATVLAKAGVPGDPAATGRSLLADARVQEKPVPA